MVTSPIKRLLTEAVTHASIETEGIVASKELLIPFLNSTYGDCEVVSGHTFASAKFARNQGTVLVTAMDRFVIGGYEEERDRVYVQSGEFSGLYLPPRGGDLLQEGFLHDQMKDAKQTREAILADSDYFNRKIKTLKGSEKAEFASRYFHKLRRGLAAHVERLDQDISGQQTAYDKMGRDAAGVGHDIPQGIGAMLDAFVGGMTSRRMTDFTQQSFHTMYGLAKEHTLPKLKVAGYKNGQPRK